GEGEAGVGCFSFLLRMIIILLFGDFIPWKSLMRLLIRFRLLEVNQNRLFFDQLFHKNQSIISTGFSAHPQEFDLIRLCNLDVLKFTLSFK
ncbi:hypothetical protein, partial [Nostoc sp.]|uniref:hypothetical protein n=1 Tax=Nostoc sp. TaxID=1180 RepID=UPI002FFC0DD1